SRLARREIAMARDVAGDEAAERERLRSVRGRMAQARELTRMGKGILGAVLDARGIGDWQYATPEERSMAFACRLCRDAGSWIAFQRLALHAQGHAGRLLHRPCRYDERRDHVLALQSLAGTYASWRREPEGWRCRAKGRRDPFACLAEYLL